MLYKISEFDIETLSISSNKDATYVPRSQRPEWAAIGLIGKLRVCKGQVTGANWIKLRDVTESIEEWLVK